MSVGESTDAEAKFPATDRYTLRGRLGEGASGTVFRADDRQLRRPVALKVLKGERGEASRWLTREFRSLGELAHPNLARLHDLHVDSEPFFTMELVEGVDLVTYARERSSELRSVADQLFAGLDALHRSGLLHRDVKPSNALVTGDGRLVLVDFGLTASSEPVGQSLAPNDGVSGTPRYLAPEVLMGNAPTPSSDAYSAGVTLYEALGGQVPRSDSWRDLLRWKGFRGIPALPPLETDCDELSELTFALMHADPRERPTMAGARAMLGFARVERRGWVGRPALVGRSSELEFFSSALEQVTSRRSSRALRVSGSRGIGRTRFVQEAIRSCGPHCIVLAGRCHPRERVAYPGLDGVIHDIDALLSMRSELEEMDEKCRSSQAVLELFPVLRRRAGTPGASHGLASRSEAITVLRGLFHAIGEALGPIVLWIDDAQWMRADEAALLRDLLAQPNDMVLLLVLGARTPESGRPLNPHLESLIDVTVELEPISARDAAALLRSLDVDPSLFADAVEAGRGNPLELVEIARELVGGPRGLEEATADARSLLERLAVANRPVSARELPWETRGAIGELIDTRLVRFEGEYASRGFVILHDRLRERIVAQLEAAQVRDLHRELAAGLLEVGDGPARLVVEHLLGAGEPQRAYPFARAAAREAQERLAFAESAELLSAALPLAPPEDRRACQLELARSLASAGNGKRAAEQFLSLVGGAEEAEAHSFEQSAAEQLLFSGHLEEGVETLELVLSRVGERMPRSRAMAFGALMLKALTLRPGKAECTVRPPSEWDEAAMRRVDALHIAALGLSMAEPILSSALALRHLDASLDLGEPGRMSRALAIQMTQLAAFRFDPAKTSALQEQSMELSRRAATAESETLVRTSAAAVAWMEGRFDDCHSLVRSVTEDLHMDAPGLRFHRDSALIVGLAALLHTGRWGELCRRVPEVLVEARQRGDRYLEVNVRVRFGGCSWLARDEPERGLAEIDGGKSTWPRRAFELTDVFAGWSQATCLLYARRAPEAMAVLRATERSARKAFLLSAGFLRTIIYDLWWRIAFAETRDSGRAPERRGVRRLRRLLLDVGSPFALASVTALDAEAALATGEKAAALERLRAAKAAYNALGMQLEASAAAARAAALHGDATATDRALSEIASLGVRRPARLVRLVFPGVDDAALS